MFADIDLRKLAEMTASERAFLSVYLAAPQSLKSLEKQFQRIRRALHTDNQPEKDEQEHFDENVKMIRNHLERHSFKSGSLCMFACWALDYFQAVPLNVAVKDQVLIDSSPYLRPLAELQDEYENVAVVVADNKKARIFLVSSAVAGDAEQVKGNVKNHVRKGGWSQQRYERRRDKELLLYAREIVQALTTLDRDEEFRRILLVGSKETCRVIHENLPKAYQDKVAEKAVDLGKGEGALNEDIMELFFEQERRSEAELWEKIRAQYLCGGLGVAGLDGVLSSAQQGRIESMIVHREFKPEGRRCRECDALTTTAAEACSACGSASVFAVDVVNEIVELLKLTGADTDFADPLPTLAEAGNIAALLRY